MKKIIPLSIACIAILACTFLSITQIDEKTQSNGYIFYLQANNSAQGKNNLRIMNSDGGMQQTLKIISGTFTVSRDGKFLFSGCENGLYI